jgi:hypothetical protein
MLDVSIAMLLCIVSLRRLARSWSFKEFTTRELFLDLQSKIIEESGVASVRPR